MQPLKSSDGDFRLEMGRSMLRSVLFDNLKLDLPLMRDGLTYVILAIWPLAEI